MSFSKPKQAQHIRPELLLHPNIPKPLHGLAPRTILGQLWWDRTRKSAYQKHHYCCHCCGEHVSKINPLMPTKNKLEAHECYRINNATGRCEYIETVALCPDCHSYIHSGRLAALLDEGKINHKTYDQIIERGNSILSQHNLKKESYSGPCAEWDKYRLVVFGFEYEPLFKTFEDWKHHYYSEHSIDGYEQEEELDYEDY